MKINTPRKISIQHNLRLKDFRNVYTVVRKVLKIFLWWYNDKYNDNLNFLQKLWPFKPFFNNIFSRLYLFCVIMWPTSLAVYNQSFQTNTQIVEDILKMYMWLFNEDYQIFAEIMTWTFFKKLLSQFSMQIFKTLESFYTHIEDLYL
jgi:hypothetical protein